jgi:hypothetical protein
MGMPAYKFQLDFFGGKRKDLVAHTGTDLG